MQTIKKNAVDSVKWSEFLKQNEYSTPFQTPDFFDFFNQVPNGVALVYSIEESNQLKALCLVTIQKENGFKGYFSRRAIVYGGPLIETDNGTALESLLKYIYSDLRKEVIFIETRNFKDYKGFAEVFQINNWNYIPYLNFQLHFKGENTDDIIGRMKYNRRREIKLSLKEGAIYTEAKNDLEVEEVYKILHDLYKVRVKLPLPDLAYFLKLFCSEIGKVFIIKHNEKIIGGAFCVFYPNLFIYTLYYCGIRDYHKKIFPTHLAIIAAVDFGIKNRLKGLDFMGAGKPNEEYGVRSYKAEFGGELVEYGRFVKIINPFLFKVGKLGLKIWQRIKK